MFCSNCGKSIRPEDATCPHCGAVLGEDRFQGNMYTSSQVRVPANALDRAPAGSLSAYTRTDYMSYDKQPEEDVYSNTTYRPVLDDAEDLTLQEQAQEAASDAPGQEEATRPETPQYEDEPAWDEPVDVVPETGDDDEVSTSPLPEIAPRAISPAVQRYMQEAEERQERRQNKAERGGFKLRLPFKKKQAEPDDEYAEEPAEDVPGADYGTDAGDQAEEPAQAEDYKTETYAEDEAADALDADYDAADAPGAFEEDLTDELEAEAYDSEAYEDGEDGEEGEGRKLLGFKFDLSALKNNRVLKYGIAGLLVLVVLIAGVRWLLYVTSNLGTKIAGVSHSTYSEGIKLIEQFTSDDYRASLVQTGSTNADYAQQLMNGDMDRLNALLPEEPQDNDELFVNTLTILHKGVQNVINADADAIYKGTTDERAAASEQEWAAVKNAVENLKNATTVAQVSAVGSDAQAALFPVPTPAPTPVPAPAPVATATPEPSTLREGMKNSELVKRMQNRLIDLGYLANGADGDFGPKTTAAVKAFQEAAGLPVDGIATEETLNALYADDAPPAPTAAAGAQGATLQV
ncbi:MAG: peptidoglycan-binding protein [Clostridia bacterium]|nr:peptidoglycan-binding protein [Clostridia bacterium]